MRVLMIRHSIAAADSPTGDFGRELTTEGRERFRKVSEWLVDHQVTVEKVVHSPRTRAVQTAEILSEVLKVPPTLQEELDWLGSGYPVTDLYRTLNATAVECVAVVGHEPSVSSSTRQMIGGGNLRFYPGAVACISFVDSQSGITVDSGQGTLDWFVDPFQLEST